MAITQGEIWWADLPAPTGSGPVVVEQGDPLNRIRIATVVCVPLTSNLMGCSSRKRVAPGTFHVANVSQITSVDRELLTERLGKDPRAKLLLFSGIDVVLGR